MLGAMNIISKPYKPFLPSDSAFEREREQRRHPPREFLERAFFAHYAHAANPFQSSPTEIARSHFPGDEITPFLFKAATVPADTLTTGWAKELALNAVGDFI